MSDTPPTTIRGNPVANDWRWWRCRLVPRGPFVPAEMIAIEDRCPETGELMADVEYQAAIDGEAVNAYDPPGWPWQPITQAEWRYMTDVAAYSRQHVPWEPPANPREPIDLNQTPSLF